MVMRCLWCLELLSLVSVGCQGDSGTGLLVQKGSDCLILKVPKGDGGGGVSVFVP